MKETIYKISLVEDPKGNKEQVVPFKSDQGDDVQGVIKIAEPSERILLLRCQSCEPIQKW